MAGMEHQAFAKGLEGVVAAKSVLSYIDGAGGRLIYWGIPIEQLAESSTFEETAFILWHLRFPKKDELDGFTAGLRKEYEVPREVLSVVSSLPASANAMDALRTGVSLLGMYDSESGTHSPEANRRKAVRLTAKMPTIVAAFDRARNGKEPVAPDRDLGLAANFLYMLRGERPDPGDARILDIALILHADHGMNASTFANMVTASTLSDMYSAVVTGIATLKGPLHGGANERVMRMVKEIGTPENAEPYVSDILAKKGRIMGFGHRVYKNYDPRARILKKFAEQTSTTPEAKNRYLIVQALEDFIIRRLSHKGIYPNVDLWSGVAYSNLGIPMDLFTPIFAISRVVGWTARDLEYWEDNRIFRPKAVYVGPQHQDYVPLDKR